MSDLTHILYTVISLTISFIFLMIIKKKVKEDKTKWLIIKIFAVTTVALHYSSIYVSFFKTGNAIVENTMLLPIYPCNVMMWLLLIVAFMKNKSSKLFKVLLDALFYIGLGGGLIGIVFNENYMNNPNLLDYDILKGLLSHSTMILGILCLFVFDFMRIRVKNVIGVIIGFIILLIDGIFVISIFNAFNLDTPNVMFLLELPFPKYPFINTFTIGIISIIVCFIITIIYEQIKLPKSERWITLVKEHFDNLKNKTSIK